MIHSEKTPQHIAIIMDGNGRWAKKRNENRIQGHMQAKKSVRDSIEFCVEKNIKYLTLFAFSTENWNRPKVEVKALMSLLKNVISDELNNLIDQNIKFNIIGDISLLPKKTKESLESAIKKTSDNLGTFFNFFSLSDNNEAANIGRQEFFDPLILILPSSFFLAADLNFIHLKVLVASHLSETCIFLFYLHKIDCKSHHL